MTARLRIVDAASLRSRGEPRLATCRECDATVEANATGAPLDAAWHSHWSETHGRIFAYCPRHRPRYAATIGDAIAAKGSRP